LYKINAMSAYLILTENKSTTFLKEIKQFITSLDANARIEKVKECKLDHTPNTETIKAIKSKSKKVDDLDVWFKKHTQNV